MSIEELEKIYKHINYQYHNEGRKFLVNIRLETNLRCIYIPCLLDNLETEVLN
jgi:hypothetical protein